MADAGAAGCAGETSVGQQGNVFIQSHACQDGGGVQHFPHARTAFGAFIADDDNVPFVDLFAADGFDGFVFRVKYPGRTGMYQHFFGYCAFFNNRAMGRNVPGQYGDAACLPIGVFYRADYFRTCDFCVFDQRADGFSGYGFAALVDESQFGKFIHNRCDTAGFFQIDHVVGAAGAEFGQVWCLFGNFIKQGQGQFDAGFVSNGRQVQRRIGRTADCHVNGDGVLESIHGHDVAGQNLFFDQTDDGFAGFFGKTGTRALEGCRYSSVAGETHTQHFGQAVHGVGGKQSGAASAAGAGAPFNAGKLLFVDFSCFKASCCFECL